MSQDDQILEDLVLGGRKFVVDAGRLDLFLNEERSVVRCDADFN